LDLSDFEYCKLEADTELSAFSFCCGDSDLNDFFFNDSKVYLDIHLATTYFFLDKDKVVAFFSMSHDSLRHEKDLLGSNRKYKDFKKQEMGLPFEAYHTAVPAIKIGRLGIGTEYQRKGYGSQLLDFIKYSVYEKRFAGCRLITVDAYNNAVDFYGKNGFNDLLHTQENQHTTLMYYDLNSLG
jgi:GNAT superfamily N-acetyltransferase